MDHVRAQLEDERSGNARSVERLERDVEEFKKQLREQMALNAQLREEQLEVKKQLSRERRKRDETEEMRRLREDKEKWGKGVVVRGRETMERVRLEREVEQMRRDMAVLAEQLKVQSQEPMQGENPLQKRVEELEAQLENANSIIDELVSGVEEALWERLLTNT